MPRITRERWSARDSSACNGLAVGLEAGPTRSTATQCLLANCPENAVKIQCGCLAGHDEWWAAGTAQSDKHADYKPCSIDVALRDLFQLSPIDLSAEAIHRRNVRP